MSPPSPPRHGPRRGAGGTYPCARGATGTLDALQKKSCSGGAGAALPHCAPYTPHVPSLLAGRGGRGHPWHPLHRPHQGPRGPPAGGRSRGAVLRGRPHKQGSRSVTPSTPCGFFVTFSPFSPAPPSPASTCGAERGRQSRHPPRQQGKRGLGRSYCSSRGSRRSLREGREEGAQRELLRARRGRRGCWGDSVTHRLAAVTLGPWCSWGALRERGRGEDAPMG